LACRSKSKAQPRTAPIQDELAIAKQPAVPVTSDDFVTETGADESVRWSDLDELNRRAALQGWLRDAFFSYDSATLSEESRKALESSAKWLRENPELILTIEGHCDERGTEQYNLALGDRRSNAAEEYLVTLGVPRDRLATISYGEERPFASGANETAWSQNRRAHLRITGRK
ncbi:MAG TPA: peptidoglycan-associated lipoprotein Pal, partial [Thermoanaerobaculia bacterium]|nr:peptidoglycan-associated lipoprotein Pal [Thermoanaerobaculia bacterium]